MRIPLLASATILAIAANPLAGADWIRVEPTIGFPTLGGHLSLDANGLAGDQVDFSDLDLDGRKATPGVEVDISPPLLPFGFNLGAYRFSNTGSADLSQDLDFGGKTYTAGTTIDSELTLRDVYAEMNLQPVRFGLGGASVGLALHQLQTDVSLSAAGVSSGGSKNLWYPALTGRAYVSPIDALQIEAAVQFMQLKLGSTKTGYLDLKAQVVYFPVHYLGVMAGWRQIAYTVQAGTDGGDLDAKLSLSGPYLGAEARF